MEENDLNSHNGMQNYHNGAYVVRRQIVTSFDSLMNIYS